MTARDKILSAIKNNQPPLQSLPEVDKLQGIRYADPLEQFVTVLEAIGGQVVLVKDEQDIADFIKHHYADEKNIITTIPGLSDIRQLDASTDAHSLENINLAILPALFAVAENGAAWLTSDEMLVRALPFICQQLAIVVEKKNIINNMQEAYIRIGDLTYPFAVFIAGPSKTADIEQSLVLGAHGPKEMIVFLMA